MLFQAHKSCGCHKSRAAKLLAAIQGKPYSTSPSKTNRMTVPAPYKLKMPTAADLSLTPTEALNGFFAINATLYLGSPGMLGDGGPFMTTDFTVFNTFFDIYGAMPCAGFQPSKSTFSDGEFVTDNTYDPATGLIATQSINGTVYKQITYNREGFIQHLELPCDLPTVITYDFVYDQYNRLTQISIVTPAACDLLYNQGYTTIYNYDYWDKTSPFQPSLVSVSGVGEAVQPTYWKLDYSVENGLIHAINAVYPEDGELIYSFADYYYDANRELNYFRLEGDGRKICTYNYDEDGLYEGFDYPKANMVLKITWENGKITEVLNEVVGNTKDRVLFTS